MSETYNEVYLKLNIAVDQKSGAVASSVDENVCEGAIQNPHSEFHIWQGTLTNGLNYLDVVSQVYLPILTHFGSRQCSTNFGGFSLI